MRPFSEWYGGAELRLKDVAIPVQDFGKAAVGKSPATPGKKVQVAVILRDKDGKELKTAVKPLELVRYAAPWMNNSVGVSDRVIPPWTPLEVNGGDVGVWNRRLSLDGLGMARQVINGGVAQLAAPMRLVAVQGRQGNRDSPRRGPKLGRRVEAEADFTGAAEAAGLRFAARTHVEFDGFVNVHLDVASAGNDRRHGRSAFPGNRLAGRRGHALLHHRGRLVRRPRCLARSLEQPGHIVRDARGRFRALHLADELRPGAALVRRSRQGLEPRAGPSRCPHRRSCARTARFISASISSRSPPR